MNLIIKWKKNKQKQEMFTKEQIQNQIEAVDKRTHDAPLGIVSTSILTSQTLARLKFQRMKKFKFSWRAKEIYQFK